MSHVLQVNDSSHLDLCFNVLKLLHNNWKGKLNVKMNKIVFTNNISSEIEEDKEKQIIKIPGNKRKANFFEHNSLNTVMYSYAPFSSV